MKMKTRIDLSKYESLYDTFDGGHDRKHLEEVRNFAVELAKKYCPDKIEVVYVAATLHDIGISISREDHEMHGYELVLQEGNLKKAYSKDEYEEILEAVKEHRASTGKPNSVVAKIVSDADKISDNTCRAITRAYLWGKKNLPTVNHDGQLLRAAHHLKEKFGPNGTGTRLYFEESNAKLQGIYKPIFDALAEYRIDKLNSLLEEGCKECD